MITPDEYRAFVANLFFRNGDLSKDFAHAAMGIHEELQEGRHATSDGNAIEEAGDLLFFGTAAEFVLQEHLASLGDTAIDEQPYGLLHCLELTKGDAPVVGGVIQSSLDLTLLNSGEPTVYWTPAAELLVRAKKWVGYGAAPSIQQARELIVHTIAATWGGVHIMLSPRNHELDTMFQTAARANMAKLGQRYKEGFSLTSAEDRDLAAEAAAIAQAS